MYTLQRRVRVLREQVQRRDLHLELLRRKIALLEDGSRGKIALQAERDDAVQRLRRSTKAAERTQQQLIEVKSQLSEVKGQLSEAADHKISALERARKIDELQSRIIDVENEKCKLISQLASYKSRARSAVESANDKRCRDDQAICVSEGPELFSLQSVIALIDDTVFGRFSGPPGGDCADQGVSGRGQSPNESVAGFQSVCGPTPALAGSSRGRLVASPADVVQCPSGVHAALPQV